MAKYRLVYFDGRGRAEVIRILLAAAYVQFVDDRIDVKDWPDLKPDLAGMDKWEQLLADSALEATLDLMSTAIALGESKKGPLEKEDDIRRFKEHTIPVAMTNYDRYILANGNNGFTVGNHELCTVTRDLFTVLDSVLHHGVFALESVKLFPAVYKVYEQVKAQPRIALYLSQRPHSNF
ncbi:hypothetical protein RvY_08683 [Ramazzottius varieornatus]|uniref:GST N-terminal domain-containing protein n=1 Tax=Ramazzottius varieornatus TaxID=947166 RepID=A0A1D1V6Q3_RAMVA|nr:hypothetical protein RvY_08683 [Ramazzottius varieornatus]